MARRHGWGGSLPADDAEARRRIVEAATRRTERGDPAQLTLSAVATDLSVTRATLYRYFSSIDDLMVAVGQAARDDFNDEVRELLHEVHDPVEWVVEALALIIERLPTNPQLTLLLDTGRTDPFVRNLTAAPAIAAGRRFLDDSGIDWTELGFDDTELDEFVELLLRFVQSMIVDPPNPPRSGPVLRRFLSRWIGPMIVQHHLSR